MAAAVQKGTTLIVGIGAYTLTGYIVEEVGVKPIADVEDIRDEDNASKTKIITNPGSEITIAVIAVGTTTSLDSLGIGSTITVNSITYMVTDVDPKRSRGAMKGTIKAIKEASMTYT